MELRPSLLDNSSSAGQGIHRILYSRIVCYQTHESPSLVRVQSHISPVHILVLYIYIYIYIKDPF
jgi:hypothetical protein